MHGIAVALLTEDREHLSTLQTRLEATRLGSAVFSHVGFPTGPTDAILRQLQDSRAEVVIVDIARAGRAARHPHHRTDSRDHPADCHLRQRRNDAAREHCGQHARGRRRISRPCRRIRSPARGADPLQFFADAIAGRSRAKPGYSLSLAPREARAAPPPPSIPLWRLHNCSWRRRSA